MVFQDSFVCGNCSKKLTVDEVFCTNCGEPRRKNLEPMYGAIGAPSSLITSPPQENPSLPSSFNQGSNHNRKFSNGLIAGVALGFIALFVFVFQLLSGKYDYSASTIEDLFRGNQSRVNDVVLKSCAAIRSKSNQWSDKLDSASLAIKFDYTYALGESSSFRKDIEGDFGTTASDGLRNEMGSKFAKLKYPESVSQSLYMRAGSICSISNSPDSLLASAKTLDSEVNAINYPPYNWEGSDFTRSKQDPNIAWKWTPNNTFSCAYGSRVCQGVSVKVLRPCLHSLRVTLNWSQIKNGSTIDSDSSSRSGARPGSVYTLIVNGYTRYYSWVDLGSLKCD